MYLIKKVNHTVKDIYDKVWDDANVANVNKFNWDKERNTPVTEARILYSEYGLHIRMKTDEKPLLARYTEQNSAVCCDSCMEFFIKPFNRDERYMNFEFNAFGTMYHSVRMSRDEFSFYDCSKEDFGVISNVADGEWTIMFTIPFRIINCIYGGYSKTMYGNIYKCAEDTESPHYASYYEIETPKPDFHRPEYFGEFELEDY